MKKRIAIAKPASDTGACYLARHCEDNYVLPSFNVVRKLLLKENNHIIAQTKVIIQ